jgi:hypothetical protein
MLDGGLSLDIYDAVAGSAAGSAGAGGLAYLGRTFGAGGEASVDHLDRSLSDERVRPSSQDRGPGPPLRTGAQALLLG